MYLHVVDSAGGRRREAAPTYRTFAAVGSLIYRSLATNLHI